MQPDAKNKIGRVDLDISAFGFGTASIGNIFPEIDEETSDAMIQTGWDRGFRFCDTPPMFVDGLSELRTGHSLRWKYRNDFVLSSKVARRLVPARRDSIDFALSTNAAPFNMELDYTYDGTMQASEDCLQRLEIGRMDISFIHGIDVFTQGDAQFEVFKQAMGGSWRAIEKLCDEGMVTAIGVGVNEWEVCHGALKQRDFDCFLHAGQYTLIEQDSLNEFLPLPAAVLQFSVAHPAILIFIAGTRMVEQLTKNLDWFCHPIPDEIWSDLKSKSLLRDDAPTLV